MNYTLIYFIGIGGIGMSNLARYFLSRGNRVAGYDKTETPLTQSLVAEGAQIHYDDDLSLIPSEFLDKEKTLVVYTPAVPCSHSEFIYFKNNGFALMKRAETLGEITKTSDALCVAGTHGKTTVSGMIAHLLRCSDVDCNAFLGGILKNYNTNLLLSEKSNYTVVEADEYDRSFHWLHPWMAVITSADPDHLDIYGTPGAYRESFEYFTSLIRENGTLLLKTDSPITPRTRKSVRVYSYSADKGDFHAENIRIGGGEIVFDFVSPTGAIEDVSLGVPVKINIENAVAAMAVAQLCGVRPEELKAAIQSFGGAKRRFDFWLKTPQIVFIDDYAHHPQELAASLESIKALYPEKKVTVIFQPHLYSRTRDFADEFAQSLSMLDDVILLDIYPAREEPITGVTSQIIFDKITSKEKVLLKKEKLLDFLKTKDLEVLAAMGAGDIDRLLPEIKQQLKEKYLK